MIETDVTTKTEKKKQLKLPGLVNVGLGEMQSSRKYHRLGKYVTKEISRQNSVNLHVMLS